MLTFALKAFISIFIIMGPFSVVPFFISLVEDLDDSEKNKIALKGVLIATAILIFSTIFGTKLFSLFGISLSSFRIAGGILLLLMGISQLHAKRSRVKTTSEEIDRAKDQDDISVFPLATPLIAGPGSISTVIILSTYESNFYCFLITIYTIILCAAILLVFLIYSKVIYKFIGYTGINIIMRLMGLILASIAIEHIVTGIKTTFNI